MNEASLNQTVSNAGTAAGNKGGGVLLRRAREAQGMDIAVLAAAMKVPQSKLEALEAERYAELPDATFVRALAQAVCRVLKVDSGPVLAQLPSAGPMALDKVESGLNTPFRDRPGRVDPLDRLWLRHPVTWIVGVLLLGAMAMAFVPTGWLRSLTGSAPAAIDAPDGAASGSGTESAGSSPSAALIPPSSSQGPAARGDRDTPVLAASSASAVLAGSAASASGAGDASTSAAGNFPGSGSIGVQIRAVESTWVEVTDLTGKVLFSRLVPAGENAGVDAPSPIRVRIGNAKGTELRVRGQIVDLGPSTKVNVATLDLQ